MRLSPCLRMERGGLEPLRIINNKTEHLVVTYQCRSARRNGGQMNLKENELLLSVRIDCERYHRHQSLSLPLQSLFTYHKSVIVEAQSQTCIDFSVDFCFNAC